MLIKHLVQLIAFTILLFSSLQLAAQNGPYILWPQPAPISFLTPLSPVQLNARAFAGPATPVPLDPYFNVNGISSPGTPFNNGGFDGSSWAFDSTLLGSTISWQSLSFPLGPANQPDVVTGATVALPSGNFGSLLVLGDLVNSAPPQARFVVQYTDGSTTAFDQNLSDWVIPRNYSGEALAACYPHRNNLDGTVDYNSVCVYGYQFPLDPKRTVKSFSMPQDRNVLVLSMLLLPPAVPGTFTYAPAAGSILSPGTYTLGTTFVPLSPGPSASFSVSLLVHPAVPPLTPAISWPTPAPIVPTTALGPAQLNASASAPFAPLVVPLAPYYRVNALYQDGSMFRERGFDGSSTAFSLNQLGPVLHFAGGTYPLGPPAVPDAVTSSTIVLPPGRFSTLYLVGAAGTQPELAQSVVITYTDGSSSSTPLDLSSWRQPQNFAGESLVASTTKADLSSGSQIAGSFNLYGYQLPVDPTRTVATLILPPNPDVIFLAAGLGVPTTYNVPGTFTYTPPAGTVPTASLQLSTTFAPQDATDFTPASATTQLLYGLLDFTLTSTSDSSVSLSLGQSTSFTFKALPINTLYSGPVTFSVSGTLPPLTTISFSPSTIPVDGGPCTVILSVHTQRLSSSVSPLSRGAVVAFCLLLCVPLAATRKRLRVTCFLLIACVTCLFPTGCGSGYASSTYPLIITATSGAYTHTLPFTLKIQAQ